MDTLVSNLTLCFFKEDILSIYIEKIRLSQSYIRTTTTQLLSNEKKNEIIDTGPIPTSPFLMITCTFGLRKQSVHIHTISNQFD